jgi:hypothetical protein
MIYFILFGIPGFLLDSPEGIGIYYIALPKTPTLSFKERA